MTTFDSVVKKMAHLSKFLARKDPKDRLLKSCFSGPITQHLQQKEIKAFQVKLNTSRRGSIAVCVSELLKVEAALRYAWDSEKYGSSRPGDAAAQHGSSVDLSIVNDAISDPDFWGNLHMLESLARVIQGCLTWIEGCPCHWELWDIKDLEFPKDVQAVWRACPVRGCRAPEIAEGALKRLLLDLSNKRASELLTTLPRELSPESRALLLQEFERARSHLVFIVNLRLDHLRKPPWCVFGCAHPSANVRKRFLRTCLQIPADTPLVAELQERSMREQVLQFLDDEADLDALPLLAKFLGRLYFCPVAERAVEGDHAQVHKKIALARNHTAAYVSLARRMRSIRDAIAADPNMLDTLAGYHDQVHSGPRALQALGLAHHPSAAYIKHYRDPMQLKIIYHCDPATMFQPALKIVSPDPPTQPPHAKALLPPPDEGQSQDPQASQRPEMLPLRRIIGKKAGPALMPPAADSTDQVAAAAETLQLERPTACEPDSVLRHYILQAMSVMLEENTGAVDSAYSVPFAEEALRSLGFVSLVNSEKDESRERSLDLNRMAMRGHVFLQLVRKALGRVVLPEATGLNQHDWAVNFLEVQGVHEITDASYEVNVGSSPICLTSLEQNLTPVVLSLEALPLESLLGLRLWKQRPRLHYKFVAPDMNADDAKLYASTACESLLPDLLAGGPFSLQGQDSMYRDKSKLLGLLLSQGFVLKTNMEVGP
ncbi:unnamed protein product [Symbiodinium sp. CCMP2592]|nr:unnamed protein product [Symbiodinium sp. CCMP2592]